MNKIKVQKLTGKEAGEKGITGWGIWEKGPSEFDWAYTDEEHCYVIEGGAEITAGGEAIVIQKGDYAVFQRGLSCRWKIREKLVKHYAFF